MTTTRRALLACAAALIAAPAFAQEVTLRMHQFLPAQANVPTNILDVWADRVEEDSGGRIEVQRFPAMQLGGTPPELYDQAVDGTADVIWTVAGYTPGRFPTAEIFELPFIAGEADAEAMSRAYWTMGERHMFDGELSDVHPLGLWVHGPGLIHADRPIEAVSDLEGLKLRAPTRTTTTLFENLGAAPVGMPVPQVPEALSRGVIEGAVIPWEVTGALRLPELVGNHTEFGDQTLYTTAFLFVMNEDAYEALPEDLQAVIDENSGLEFSAFAGAQMAEDDGPARQAAVDAGNNIVTLTPEQVAEWQAAAQPVTDAWIEGNADGRALVDEARALIEENAM
ncbi:TRAP-type C4-dicarboxylate transport system substrate-binding protein [Hasllibacter halocynthiae]|uniref:TRAP-type C4-dicarboxylate transport system substrate-binding protein n=1 Tax=Hasllibacter halocynthiae TaxID=595589 RepID=A0A2T0X381_9RHOB|nr:TRAP transporter substrate-binding protein [Hasllibacter halocynthiae]PRY93314.1 TRAP-type C4-dicarboxylate transport system substrate-binding protein [Hasllibacter halocynthiae]